MNRCKTPKLERDACYALAKYVRWYGCRWKAEVLRHWESGYRAPFLLDEEYGAFMRVRNERGPSGLARITTGMVS